MARAVLSSLLLGLLVVQAFCRVPDQFASQSAASNDACGMCKLGVRVLGDLMCDPSVEDTVATWLVDNICSQFQKDQKQQCLDLVVGLTPALVEWLRANASPDTLCSEAGVCGTAAAQLTTAAPKLHVNKPNDMTCPVCMFVVSRLKSQIMDPVTQEQIQQYSMAACDKMPEGMMRDACVAFVQQCEMTFVKYIGTMEPSEVCMMIGTCLDQALARVGPAAPLKARAVVAANQLVTLMQAPPSNDHCETCKVVVMEMHQLLANPELQTQLVDYAKQACALVPSFADSCITDVDQYAPMVFGMMLAYLQPEQVCVQLQLCPPPSMMRSFSMQATMLGSKYNKFSQAKTLAA
eukprot:GHUV01000875.1.p1 GENE.GHUV01000875.1~~GHUV01000875.1.p1  ORF type:complete len:350 (+),score=80.78 GHUV01000875.1:180-1229(+)